MTTNNRIIISSDHADIALRQTIAKHVETRGYEVLDIGPTTSRITPNTGKPPRRVWHRVNSTSAFCSAARVKAS